MSEVIYKIRVDRPCRLFIDEEEVMTLEESKLTKITLPVGEYLRKVVAIDDSTIFDEKVISLIHGKVDIISLDAIALGKQNALTKEKFVVGDLCFSPSEDRLSVEVKYISGKRQVDTISIPEQIEYAGYIYPVTSIRERAFECCPSLTSIIIPNSVKSIGAYAFNACESLTSINIPNSVTSIGVCAFSGCDSLTSITIPNSVKSIGKRTFQNCTSLASIIIPNGVTSIGYGAFDCCFSLTSITIPNSVTTIDDRAFMFCLSLTSIVVEDGNKVYDSRENCNAIIETKTNTLIRGGNMTIIPNDVTTIGASAFSHCKSLASITIPNSVTSIEAFAFSNCDSLTTIVIPNSVTSIGKHAFNDCSSLTSIVVETGNKVYDSRNNCNAIIETETNEFIASCQTTIIPEGVVERKFGIVWDDDEDDV